MTTECKLWLYNMFSIKGIVFHDYFMTNVVHDSTPKVTTAGVTIF